MANEHVDFQHRMDSASLTAVQKGQLWKYFHQHGAEAAFQELERMTSSAPVIQMRAESLPYPVWGAKGIDDASRRQMNMAMRLPVSIAGALMPDAHVGYGLPIGGVLAVDNAVIPYGIGVDIACRVRVSLFAVPQNFLETQRSHLVNALLTQTAFGKGCNWAKNPAQHEVMESPLWNELPMVKPLKQNAAIQLGTSGGGNHFVEWGDFHLREDFSSTLRAGYYLALASHSGSRALGMAIANYFTDLAKKKHPDLNGEVANLSWLSLDEEEGQQYWKAMNLAGEYAHANHAVIHERVAQAMRMDAVAHFENHHNFAWKEKIALENGDQVNAIVHRKGATPAGKGVIGFIPGTMAHSGFLVEGRGSAASLNSASHGAGRAMSRTAAKKTINPDEVKRYLKGRKVQLLSAGLDEAPFAYKDPEQVMAAQADLVRTRGEFVPRIVRMADDGFTED